LVVSASWLVAYHLRFDFNPTTEAIAQMARYGPWVVFLKLLILYLLGQFSGLLSYFSIPDLRHLFYSVGTSSGLLFGMRVLAPQLFDVPRGVLAVDLLLSFAGLAAVRLGFRLVRENYFSGKISLQPARRIGIVGAGDAGARLAREFLIKKSVGMRPVAFFDDDQGKWRSRVHDIPVLGGPELLLQDTGHTLDEVVIAMPSAPAKRIGEVVKILQQAKLKFATVPSLDQLATGRVKVSQLRPVEIQDLLGREPVRLDTDNIREILKNRIVMVTGAGGSIGSELCRQIVSFQPKQLLLVEQSDEQLLQIERELRETGYGDVLIPLLADILDMGRMRSFFERFQPAVIFHAAAHKHVPMMESQPTEAIKNNAFGTARLGELALEYDVDRFVLISSDKAINPTNVMGATKRLAEIYLQALSAKTSGATKFMAVRFGNVLGSSGSVIPIFSKQIAAGGPVKVTHPDVTRYFMTIPEAVGLVLQSGAQGSGGEIFVLDMGKPVKIVDLARQLIELSGLRPNDDIEIVFTGLRPGEKLYEELSHKGENFTPTHHPKIMRFVSEPLPLHEVRKHFERLAAKLDDAEPGQLKLLLKQAVPEYLPYMKA
jgi:FlaA1/EpsC-like NDP-sugar epimerase